MDYKNIWLTVLTRLEPTIARGKFLTWFRETALLAAADGRAVVGAPSEFVRNWLSAKYALKILQAIQEQLPEISEIEFTVDALLGDPSDPRTVDLAANFAKEGDKKIRKVAGTQEVRVTTGGIRSALLNPRYTLQNFVPGEGNRLAHAAGMSVARLPGQTYNPLFIYGSVGLGKTHLLSAIGHEALVNDPSKVVVYATAEMFMNEFIDAIKNRKTDVLRKRYRAVDIFLLDDVQFLEGAEKTQAEFFNIFNALHGAGKQIVVTSDRPPSELSEIMDRLRSRLTWGLVTEIEQPDFQSRLAILQTKTQDRRAFLQPEILEFIARNVTDSVRALEGVLTTVLGEADLLDTQPTIDSITRLLKKLNRKEKVVGIPARTAVACTPAGIIQSVSEQFSVPVTEMVGSSRRSDLTLARAVAMLILRDSLGLGFAAVGDHFGRSHATVMHAIKKIQGSLESDEQLAGQVSACRSALSL